MSYQFLLSFIFAFGIHLWSWTHCAEHSAMGHSKLDSCNVVNTIFINLTDKCERLLLLYLYYHTHTQAVQCVSLFIVVQLYVIYAVVS